MKDIPAISCVSIAGSSEIIKSSIETYPSLASHLGQKFSLFLSQLHVFFDVPPSPCTKMMLHVGLEHV